MPDGVWVTAGTLTLPYGTLRTIHEGVSEVRVKENLRTGLKQVAKRVSLLGREDTLAMNEVAFLREIDHQNVARVFDVAEVAGSDPALAEVEIIMPYYENGSLYDAMARGERFSSGQARDLTVKALRGLAHLHDQRRILHRDLKPGNLFLANDESLVKIGDFGEAVRMDEQGTAEPLLQPQYWTAPETFNGSRYAVTAEIFSMGMSFREVLSGSYPYDDYTREELAKRLSKNQRALRDRHLECAVHVPTSLRLIAQRASHRSVNRRYQTADAMLEALFSARFVDWQWPVEDDDAQMSWTGAWHGEELRVSVRSVRGRGWRAQGLRDCPSGWRRLSGCPDADAQTPLEAASKVFSHIERQVVRT
jgi:serine/threonine protein kinase